MGRILAISVVLGVLYSIIYHSFFAPPTDEEIRQLETKISPKLLTWSLLHDTENHQCYIKAKGEIDKYSSCMNTIVEELTLAGLKENIDDNSSYLDFKDKLYDAKREQRKYGERIIENYSEYIGQVVTEVAEQ